MENRLKLYKVTCQGMHGGLGDRHAHGIAYVVAENTYSAYKMLRKFLDENDLGYSGDRELKSVELIADSYIYSDIGYMLHLPESVPF